MNSSEQKETLLRYFRTPPRSPSFRTESTREYTRLLGTGNSALENAVVWAAASDIPGYRALIRSQKEYFRSLGKSFEWKFSVLFYPEELKAVLVEEGFAAGEREELLLWTEECSLPKDGTELSVRELEIPRDLEEIVGIQSQVWHADLGWLKDDLGREKAADPESIFFYGALEERGRIVSAGWVRIHKETATLHGGSTVQEFRRKGAFTALVRIRLLKAKEKGAKVVLVEASPRSLPILEKLGFIPQGETRPFLYTSR